MLQQIQKLATVLTVFSSILVFGTLFNTFSYDSYPPTLDYKPLSPPGIDFRVVYEASQSILQGFDGYGDMTNYVYLPIVGVLYLPLAFFDVQTAYLIFVLLSSFLLAASCYLAFRIFDSDRGVSVLAAVLIFTATAQSYPFTFGAERGNYDPLAVFVIALSLYTLSRNKQVLSGALFGFAVGLKIYPLIASPIFLPRITWRWIAACASSLTLSIFCLGKIGLELFFKRFSDIQGDPVVWHGNHSIYSWLWINKLDTDWAKPLVFSLIALFVVAILCYYTVKKPKLKILPLGNVALPTVGFSWIELCLLSSSFILMCILTDTSHDYRLVIHVFPFSLLCAYYVKQEESNRGLFWILIVFSLLYAAILLPRFSLTKTPILLTTLFLTILLFCVQLVRERKPKASE